MALVVLASAKGAPGTTTAALALAAMWPRPVLMADCDPAGGDVALRMPSRAGGPLDPDTGLVSLAAAARRGLQSGRLPGDLVADHTQQVVGGLDVLVGLRTAEQSAGTDVLWPLLGGALAGLQGVDVVADVGRIGPGGSVLPVVRCAQLVVLVCRASVSSVFHTRERLATLTATLRASSVDAVRTAVLVVADPKEPRSVDSVRQALARQEHAPDHVWTLAWDVKGAQVFDGLQVSRPQRTALVLSAAEVAAAAAELVLPFHRPAAQAVGPDGSAVGAPPAPEPTTRAQLRRRNSLVAGGEA